MEPSEPDDALTHARGAAAEVLRERDDGYWKLVMDDPDGPAPTGHP